jgi:CPA2 family monovalent cation:H+ antiporter-2
LGVRIVNLRRSGGKVVPVSDNPLIQDGDTLVLSGRAESLAIATQILLKG